MIGFVNILLIFVWGLIVPFLLGMLTDRLLAGSEGKLCARNLAFGFMLMAAVFELLAVPMIFLHTSFHVLKYSWILAVLGLSLLSVLVNRRTLFQKLQAPVDVKQPDKMTLFIWAAVILLILLQVYLLAGHTHRDTDDARFVAEALEAVEKDTMLSYHPITGELLSRPAGEMSKDIMSPYPIFLGLVSALFQLPPAVAAHLILPILLIPFCYVVYYVIADFFFGGNKKYSGLFLVFLSVIHLFSFESIYASGYTLLTIIWQGRSVAAMILLPLLWYLLLRMTGEHVIKPKEYLLLAVSMLSCAMLSGMGIMLSLLLSIAYMCVYVFQKKSLKTVPWMLLSMCPNIVCMILSRLLLWR